MLALATSVRFAEHEIPPSLADRSDGHPERPDRIRAVHEALRQAGMISQSMKRRTDEAMKGAEMSPLQQAGKGWLSLDLDMGLDAGGPALQIFDPGAPADDETLQLVHPPEYIRFIGDIAHRGGGYADHGETYVGPASDEVARLCVAATIRGTDLVASGKTRRAFAAVRPPGHHAEAAKAMGFCLFATAAIAVRHLQRVHGLARVAVVDFDVHHGNGTQAVFWRDPRVLNISLHQDPRTLWPGTGFADEVGEGPGRGFCVNIPLPPGTNDERYLRALREQVLGRVADFNPDALVVCAGFDAHAADPLAQLALSTDGFGEIGRELAHLADDVCGGRLIACLEGGYSLRALGQSVVSFLRSLAQ